MGRDRYVDDAILRYCDSRSAEDISELIGGQLTPTEVAERAKELLKSPDWLTEADLQRLVDLKLRRILSELEVQFLSLDNAKVQLALLKEIGARLDRRMAARDDELDKWSGNMGRLLLRSVDLALGYMRGALRDEVDAGRWDELLKEGLAFAKVEIDRHEAVGP